MTRQYEWEYGGRQWTWTLHAPEALYDYYRQRLRAPTENYSIYVTHPLDDPYLKALVERIEDAAMKEGFDEWETVNFAVSFVQSLPYTPDNVATAYDEYPRYPIETLVDYGGDCEDTSILMAAILDTMGYGVVLLALPGHMAVGVLGGEGIYGSYYEYDGGKYFYLETTGMGWGIGELPEEYEAESVHIYDIVPVPILTHHWNARLTATDVELTVAVENLGTATAYEVYVWAGFDADGGVLWNPEGSEGFDIGPDYIATITIYLTIPQKKHTRIVVQIVDDGYAVDESYSKWFDT